MSKLDEAEIEIEGWRESRQLVMSELRRVGRIVESLDSKVGSDLTSMKVEIATIKTKVALYAVVAGAIASAILSAVISYLMGK